MKSQFIDQLRSGDAVNDIFLLTEKTVARKKDGNPYLTLAFSDKTGVAKAVMWDNIDVAASEIKAGDFVRISGSVSEYRGVIQIVVKDMAATGDSDLDTADFVPKTTKNITAMTERMKQIIDSVKTDCLRDLLKSFFDEPEFLKIYQSAPAAKKMHHAYMGGLLEHSLSLAILVERVAPHYIGIDKDMLIAGALLHDIGKVREFDFRTGIDYTDEGRLLTHIVIGLEMIEDRIRSIPDFPRDKAILLKHLIVSHHGTREFGSPEPPKTLEGLLLNYLDEIDSKINGVREFMAANESDGNWTPYHGAMGRHFFKGFIS